MKQNASVKETANADLDVNVVKKNLAVEEKVKVMEKNVVLKVAKNRVALVKIVLKIPANAPMAAVKVQQKVVVEHQTANVKIVNVLQDANVEKDNAFALQKKDVAQALELTSIQSADIMRFLLIQ